MNPWDFEDWLTEEGDKVVRKAATVNGPDALDACDKLIYEMWLLDTERRNGGVSQYFCNRGLKQWDALSEAASARLPSFKTFAIAVNNVVGRSTNPYKAVIESNVDLDRHYDEYAIQLLTELKRAVETGKGTRI
jgi:hypothetical protein